KREVWSEILGMRGHRARKIRLGKLCVPGVTSEIAESRERLAVVPIDLQNLRECLACGVLLPHLPLQIAKIRKRVDVIWRQCQRIFQVTIGGLKIARGR